MICTVTKCCSGERFNKNGMGGACSMYRGDKRYVQGFGGETEEKGPLGRPRHRWENNIKMDLQEVGWGHGLD